MDALKQSQSENSMIVAAGRDIENLTRLLTNACIALEKHGEIYDQELSMWWHNRQCAMRQEQNRRQAEVEEQKCLLVKQARAKLTPEERKALGIE